MAAVAHLIEAMRTWRPFAGQSGQLPPPELVDEVMQARQDAELPPDLRAALDAAQLHERAGEEENRPRTVVMLPDGERPFLATDAPQVLQARYGLNTAQTEAASSYLRKALRARRRAQRRGQGFVHNW